MRFTLLIMMLLSSITLAGCSGGSKYLSTDRNNPIVSFVDDQSLAIKATSAVSKDKELWEKSHISIISYNNDVLIVGQVPGKDLRDKVEEVVSQVPKVSRVYNQLEIKEPSSFMTRTKDAWITTSAKAKLLTEPNLKSGSIKIITEENIVYLMGNPQPEDKEVAIDIIKNIGGVEQVIDVFKENEDTPEITG